MRIPDVGWVTGLLLLVQVKFLWDERQNEDALSCLIDENMRECQGASPSHGPGARASTVFCVQFVLRSQCSSTPLTRRFEFDLESSDQT